MKITMYELLGMVKDDKAPKKIKYRQNIFEFVHGLGDYKPDDIKKYHGNYLFHYLFEEEVIFLNDEVEILEEEKKIPEKIEEPRFNKGRYYIKDINGDDTEITGIERTLRLKINEIIDYLKSKGE